MNKNITQKIKQLFLLMIYKYDMNKLKFILTLSFLISLIGIASAQQNCIKDRFDIKWDREITTNQVSEYTVSDNLWTIKTKDINAKYTLWKWDKKIKSEQGEKFFFNFEDEGEYILKSSFSIEGCKYELEKRLEIFYKSIIYIWYDLKEFEIWYESNFKNNAILFNKVLVSNNIFSEDEIKNKILEKQNAIKNAGTILINNKETDTIFQVLSKLSKSENLNLANKEIFVINNTNKHFMKRILSKYIVLIDNQSTYLINDDHILNILSDLSFGRDVVEESLIEVFPLSFQKTSGWLLLSYLIDNLIANDFPINLIWLLLTLTVATLFITAFRQIVWFSVFGTFSPLLFGLSISVLWTQASIIFFLIAFIATVITRMITKKFYLLNSAKISLLITIYFMTILVVLWLDKSLWFNMIDLQIFNNAFSIFPIIFLILVTDKVFNEWFKIFSKWWLISLAEFILVSIFVYITISSTRIRLVLLSYPELIILILILIMIVWRFTWLQVLEYFRFMPLLKWEGDEEE